jgi:hypothetical protein
VDLGGLRALVRDLNFQAHGVPATVIPPDEEPIQTRVVWLTPSTEIVPAGSDARRAEARRTMGIRRDEVPAVPRGTLVDVTEHGQTAPDEWRVDAMEKVEADHFRVVVVPVS